MSVEKNILSVEEKANITDKKRTANLALLFGSALIVFINFSSSITMLPLYVLELGGTEFISGLQNTIFFFSAIVLRAYFGPLADSRGRKLPLIIGAGAFATAPLLFYFSSSLWMLVFSRIYQAIGLAAFFSSSTSLVADLAPEDKTGSYISSYRILMSLALLIGPAGSVLLVNNYGYNTWFLVSFLIGTAGVILTFLLKTPAPLETERIGSWKKFKAVLSNRKLWRTLQGITLIAVCIGALLTYAVIHVSQNTDLVNPAVYFTYYAMAGITANLYAGRLSDKYGRQAVFWPSITICGLGLASLFFISAGNFVTIISGFFSGIGAASSVSIGFAWAIDIIEEKMRATALALFESVIDSSIALGAFLFGLAGSWIGLGTTFGLTGLVVILFGLLFIIETIAGKSS